MIHPTAIIDPSATLGKNVSVGAFSIIDANVTIGDNCKIDPHVWIANQSTLGSDNFVGYGSHIGGDPQDHSFDSSIESFVKIGDHNTIREHVTINRSTSAGGATTMGDHNMLMINSHLAHDVQMGDHNILANAVLLAGHIQLGNHAFLGGGAGFHQFIKIGDYAMSQGNAAISKDIPPYAMVHGQNQLGGLNAIALRRAGFAPKTRSEIKELFKLLFKSEHNMAEALTECQKQSWSPAAQALIDSVTTPSKKGVMM